MGLIKYSVGPCAAALRVTIVPAAAYMRIGFKYLDCILASSSNPAKTGMI